MTVQRCPERNFLSNPRRIHSEKEDEEKEKWGLPGALIGCSPASPPSPPSSVDQLLFEVKNAYNKPPPPSA